MGSLAPTAAHAVRVQGLQTSALRAGSHTRQGHWVRGLQASSTPVEAVDDANSLTYRAPVARPRGDANNPAQPRPRRAELCSMQMSRSRRPAVCRREIVPCARALRQTQPVPCQSTYEWMCARRGHSIARGECMQSSNHFLTP